MTVKDINEIKPLRDYIPMERVKEATVEYNQKLEHFKEKYFDKVIEKFISITKGADMRYIFKLDKWKFKFGFEQKDIMNLDPAHPEYSEQIIHDFFSEVAKELGIEKTNSYMAAPPQDNTSPIFFILEFKNPLKEK